MLSGLKAFIRSRQLFSQIVRQPARIRIFSTMQKLDAAAIAKRKRSVEASDEDDLLVFTTVRGKGSIKAQKAEDTSQGSSDQAEASSSTPSDSTGKCECFVQ